MTNGDNPKIVNEPIRLTYRATVPGSTRAAAIIRWGMFGIAVLIFQAGVVVLFNPTFAISEQLGGGIFGTPFAPLRGYDKNQNNDHMRWEYIPKGLAYLAIFLLTQWLLLKRRGNWRLDRLGYGPLSRKSAAVLGLLAMMLTIGLLATLMEIPDWWKRLTVTLSPKENHQVLDQHFAVVWVVMGIIWLGWGVVFWRYGRNLDHYTAVGRILRKLIAGTVLEMLVAAPVHVWLVYKYDDECYCTRGSYTGVVFGCTAVVWLFGPGVFLLFMREKRRRESMRPAADPPTIASA